MESSAMEEIRYNLTIDITNNTDKFIGEPLFIAGNFNKWKPDVFSPGVIPGLGQHRRFVLSNLQKGTLEFRITRGSWATVTSGINGNLEAPFTVTVGQEASVSIHIDAWRDMFPASTASPQVHVLDEAFFLPELNVRKKIWIYLPAGYQTTEKRYPVIYMHDGQHLFDEATSTGRTGPVEWRVDETIDNSPHDAIVVAIDSAADAQERKNEYLLNPGEMVSEPQGRSYLSDVVSTLKPFIDHHYRTLPDAKHTAMAGSSLGGLLTLYAGLLYPEVFGSLGIFSPSVWMDDRLLLSDAIESRLRQKADLHRQNYYLYGGEQEKRATPDAVAVNMTGNIRAFASVLQDDHRFEVKININPVGKHGALYWQTAFPPFYEWWYKTLL